MNIVLVSFAQTFNRSLKAKKKKKKKNKLKIPDCNGIWCWKWDKGQEEGGRGETEERAGRSRHTTASAQRNIVKKMADASDVR